MEILMIENILLCLVWLHHCISTTLNTRITATTGQSSLDANYSISQSAESKQRDKISNNTRNDERTERGYGKATRNLDADS